MSIHNLFTANADGAMIPASSEAILNAARQVLAHRVRRGASLQSPQKTGECLTTRLGQLDYEVFGLILLDKRHRVIECFDLFRGTIDGASVHPREIVKLALQKGAAACVVYHIHPSGVQEPSQADELITARVKEALALIDVRLLDHLLGGKLRVTLLVQMREIVRRVSPNGPRPRGDTVVTLSSRVSSQHTFYTMGADGYFTPPSRWAAISVKRTFPGHRLGCVPKYNGSSDSHREINVH